jgi:hypothetical protein
VSASSERREIRGKSRFLLLFQERREFNFQQLGENQSHINISFPFLSLIERAKREKDKTLSVERSVLVLEKSLSFLFSLL